MWQIIASIFKISLHFCNVIRTKTLLFVPSLSHYCTKHPKDASNNMVYSVSEVPHVNVKVTGIFCQSEARAHFKMVLLPDHVFLIY